MMNIQQLSDLPSVEELATSCAASLCDYPHGVIVRQARNVIRDAREALRAGRPSFDLANEVCRRTHRLAAPSMCSVVNATGVILHTNLGRAPLSPHLPTYGYSNLEYDLTTGKRGRRDEHITDILESLLDSSAMVINNNAAAVFLVLHEL